MKYILSAFEKYDIKYDAKNKILHLYGKVNVLDFVVLKALLKKSNIELNDIRVN